MPIFWGFVLICARVSQLLEAAAIVICRQAGLVFSDQDVQTTTLSRDCFRHVSSFDTDSTFAEWYLLFVTWVNVRRSTHSCLAKSFFV